MTEAYRLGTAAPARRALAQGLPSDVALAAADFVTGPLLENPYRVGKPLRAELTGVRSARVAREWRVLYEVDEEQHLVIVLDIRHRGSAYRPR